MVRHRSLLSTAICVSLGADSLALHMSAALANNWLQPKLLPDSWPSKLCEIINIYCFKMLSFGVICYISKDNYDTLYLPPIFRKFLSLFICYSLSPSSLHLGVYSIFLSCCHFKCIWGKIKINKYIQFSTFYQKSKEVNLKYRFEGRQG